jgi:ubiquinone biosynthesis protein
MARSTESPSPGLLRELGSLTVSTYRVSQGFVPLLRMLGSDSDVTRQDLAAAIDRAFE